MTLASIASVARDTFYTDVSESDVLRAVCKNQQVVSAIASGKDVDNVLESNMPALMSIIGEGLKNNQPEATSPTSGSTDVLTDDVLNDVANMVAIMAKGFDGQKLREYIKDHPDIQQGVDAVATNGESAVKSYLMKKVPEIAISYMKGK